MFVVSRSWQRAVVAGTLPTADMVIVIGRAQEVLCGAAPLAYCVGSAAVDRHGGRKREKSMAWTTPVLVEICVGLEINGYLPAEF